MIKFHLPKKQLKDMIIKEEKLMPGLMKKGSKAKTIKVSEQGKSKSVPGKKIGNSKPTSAPKSSYQARTEYKVR